MTRITYRKSGNVLHSKYDLIAINKILNVTLDVFNLSGFISLKDSNEVIGSQFEAKTLSALKKEAKKRLAQEGVNFKQEVRPRVKKEEVINEKD